MENQNESSVNANRAEDPRNSKYIHTSTLEKLASTITGSHLGWLVVDTWLKKAKYVLVSDPETHDAWRREEEQNPRKISARKLSEWNETDKALLAAMAAGIVENAPLFAHEIMHYFLKKNDEVTVSKRFMDFMHENSTVTFGPDQTPKTEPPAQVKPMTKEEYWQSIDAMIDDPGMTLIQNVIARWKERQARAN